MRDGIRVLHVIPSMARNDGGPSRAMALIERALQGDDIRIEVATTDDDGRGRRLSGPFDVDGRAAGQTTESPARRYFPKRSEFYKFSPGLARWLWRHVRDYDLVHIHALFSFSSVAAAFIARRAGVPYVVRPLGTLNQYGVSQRRPWLKRLSLRFVEGPILRHAAAVHFTAEAEQHEAEALQIPMRGVVIPLAVDTPDTADTATVQARFPALATRPYVLFLSRIDPKKNVEAVLDAMVLLVRDRPDLLLVIAGDGDHDYVAELKRRAHALGLGDRVVWTGFVDGGMKAAVLQGASLFVLPSYSENFGIAAAEALAAGLPCVLGQGVAIARDVEAAGAGIAVAPTSEATAAALKRYLDEDALRGQASLRAREFAATQYSVASMGERLRALYRSLLSAAPDSTGPAG